jgi:beta-lactamase regulating signal transducer with metallopeptidase domain
MTGLFDFLPSGFAHAFGWSLLHSFWQGFALLLLAVALLFLMKGKSPRSRYAVVYIIMMLIPLSFTVTFWLNWEARIPGPGPGSTPLSGFTAYESGQIGPVAPADEPVGWKESLVRSLDAHTHWFFLVWLIGFMFFSARFAGSLWFTYRLRSRGLIYPGAYWNLRLEKLSGQLGLKKAVRLAESHLASVPMTAGFLRPVILLPVGTLAGVPPQMIDAIILHELAHILRKDYLLNIAQSFVEVMFFYHPVTWWLSDKIRQEREHICDDIALEITKDRINYIKALTTMEEKNLKTPVFANAMAGSGKNLLARMKRLAGMERGSKGIAEGMVAIVLLAGMIIAVSAHALSLSESKTGPRAGELASLDLTGGESSGKSTTFLHPSLIDDLAGHLNPSADLSINAGPDTIISTSSSGRVRILVYTDTIRPGDRESLDALVESIDNEKKVNKIIEKEVVVISGDVAASDSLRKVVVISDGDSMRVITGGRTIVLPEGYDTTISGKSFRFYGYEDFPEFDAWKDIQADGFYFEDDNIRMAKEMEQAGREMEMKWIEMEAQIDAMEDYHKDAAKQFDEQRMIITMPAPGGEWKWEGQEPPAPPVRKSEKIIRQELRDDGLVTRGKQYIVELNDRYMYINGVRQPREIYKKYRKLVESLESLDLESGGSFKMIF